MSKIERWLNALRVSSRGVPAIPAKAHRRQGNGKQPFFAKTPPFNAQRPIMSSLRLRSGQALSAAKDLFKTHPGGVAKTATINDRCCALGCQGTRHMAPPRPAPPGGSAAANTSTTAAPSGITRQSHVTSLRGGFLVDGAEGRVGVSE